MKMTLMTAVLTMTIFCLKPCLNDVVDGDDCRIGVDLLVGVGCQLHRRRATWAMNFSNGFDPRGADDDGHHHLRRVAG